MTQAQQPVVEMRGVTKRFLEVTANDAIDFTLFRGEICALLGENGAGKTTLMNILFGYYAADGGEIFIKGEKADLASPRDAIARGVGMIHQHFTLVPSQSVLENIIIGKAGGFFLDMAAAREKLLGLQRRFGLPVDPDAPVWTLSVGEQQKVEILKALYREVDILIMDEPTAVLAPSEVGDLFRTLRALVDEGRSVVFISHKLNEVMEISDRILVLRRGRLVAEKKTAATTTQELVREMVGRDLLERIKKKPLELGETVLEIRGLTVLNDKGLEAVRSLDLEVRSREILGIAGVSGNGQTELSEALFGIRSPAAGSVRVQGRLLAPASPAAAVAAGMARIPEDRIETGLLMDLSVEENLILERHAGAAFQKRGLMRFPAIHRYSEELIGRFNILTAGREAAVKSLSGGNLQKVILARELSGRTVLVVASQPTRGLDVGAMEYIHQCLLAEKERGSAVVLISEDLDEIFTICDRIIVMYEGRIRGEVDAGKAVRDQIGLWMTGVTS